MLQILFLTIGRIALPASVKALIYKTKEELQTFGNFFTPDHFILQWQLASSKIYSKAPSLPLREGGLHVSEAVGSRDPEKAHPRLRQALPEGSLKEGKITNP